MHSPINQKTHKWYTTVYISVLSISTLIAYNRMMMMIIITAVLLTIMIPMRGIICSARVCAKPSSEDASCVRVSADFSSCFLLALTTRALKHAHMLSEVRGSVTVRWRRPFIVASNFLPLYFQMVNLWTVAHAARFFFSSGDNSLFFFLPQFQRWRGEAKPRTRRVWSRWCGKTKLLLFCKNWRVQPQVVPGVCFSM